MITMTDAEKKQIESRMWELSPQTKGTFLDVIIENITEFDLEDGKFTKESIAQEIMEDFQTDWWSYVTRAKQSLLTNKGILEQGWLVQFSTRPTRIYKVVDVNPSNAVLEDILNGEKELVSASAQVIVLFKPENKQQKDD